MAARTRGWAQRRTSVTSTGAWAGTLNAFVGTSRDPANNNETTPVDLAFEVKAGDSVTIRWGGRLGNVAYQAGTANSCVWDLVLVYETQVPNDSTKRWFVGSADTFTQSGATGVDWTCDRNYTFTVPANCTGTIRIYVKAWVRVTATSSTIADINSDASTWGGSSEVFPAGIGSHSFTPGLIRCGTGLSSLTLSGFTAPASYGDTASAAFVTAAAPRISVAGETYTVSWRRGDTDAELASSSIAAGTSTSLPAVTRAIDNVLPAQSTAMKIRLTPNNSALSTALGGAGLPWTHFTSVPSSPGTVTHNTTTQEVSFTGAFTADPRLTFVHLLQKNDNTFGTPPLSKNIASKQRLTSDIGFLSARIVNARSEGINGITWSVSLRDSGLLVPAVTNTPTSTTQGGQAGWGNSFTTWIDSLPGGTWNKICTITAPSSATGLGAGGSEALTLIASNPNYRIVCGGGPGTVDTDTKHFTPGADFLVGLCVFDVSTMRTLALDSSPVPSVFIGRFNLATGQAEYLDSDGATWVPATGVDVYSHNLTVSPTDANVYTKTFTGVQTASWGAADLFIIGKCNIGGVPVNDFSKEIVVSGINNHNSYKFDPTGLFK